MTKEEMIKKIIQMMKKASELEVRRIYYLIESFLN